MAKDINTDKENTEEEKKDLLNVLEDADALNERLEKTQEYAKRNVKVILGLGAVVVVAVIGYFVVNSLSKSANNNAEVALYPAVHDIEKNASDLALDGNGKNSKGLNSVITEYSSALAATQARVLAAGEYMKKKDFPKAIELLSSASCDDKLVEQNRLALLGDAYLENKDVDNAIANYKKAVGYASNKLFTPTHLVKLAVAYEVKGDYKSAVETYEKFELEYPLNQNINQVQSFKALALQKAGA